MLGPQSGEPEAFVFPPIRIVANADQRIVEQPDDRGDHPLARKAATAQVHVHTFTQLRQCMGEGGKTAKLGLVAKSCPIRMVTVLLASPLVAPGSLYMASRIGAYPNILPCRRNC